MKTSVVLFTADLRVHDNPVLRSALAESERVVPLFVLDSGMASSGFLAPNRAAFLADCLADLDGALRDRGGRLILRHGDVVAETCQVADETGAGAVHIAGGASGYAQRREERLRAALARSRRELRVHDAVVNVIAPGRIVPSGSPAPRTRGSGTRASDPAAHGTTPSSPSAPRTAAKDHYAVFTPYFRRWRAETARAVVAAPRRIAVPDVPSDPLPSAKSFSGGEVSPGLRTGGEGEGRRRMRRWVSGPLTDYADRHDDLAGDATSRLSPYLHFGCLSPVELAYLAGKHGGAGANAFVRQLAWRDFHHQVLAARPAAAHEDYRPRGDHWRDDEREIAAWRDGTTGYPIVDAAMRQLRYEGWTHNRGRLLAASFLAKTLYVDWRVGAAHFLGLLVDGDVANNQLNWQWVAGTGTDTRPNRVLNPLAQAARFDPQGTYVRRWVPELAGVEGAAVHRPWRLPQERRARLEYPGPIVDLGDALTRFRQAATTRPATTADVSLPAGRERHSTARHHVLVRDPPALLARRQRPGHPGRQGRHPQQPGDQGRGEPVPAGRPAQHRVAPVRHGDTARLDPFATCPAHEFPRAAGVRDAVGRAVQQYGASAVELCDGFVQRAPRRHGDDPAHQRVVRDPQPRTPAHGVANQHHGHRAEQLAQFVECPPGVPRGVGPFAVPAPVAVPGRPQRDVVTVHGPQDRPAERDHAHSGRPPPGRRPRHALRHPTVQQQHRRAHVTGHRAHAQGRPGNAALF